MADVKKIATRESYGNALVACAEDFPELVVLDADLAGATKTGTFKKAYPDRHIDCGIAECNMTGIAAGLATCGKIPFISSFAMFAAGRNFEQVRNSIGYPHLNVKIGATHAGITVGEDGATHQCNEDIALMRTIPGMTVIVPSDDIEAKAAVRAALEMDGPVYLRFGRAAVPVINDNADYKFEIGKGVVLKEGADVSIIATGICVEGAMGAAEMLKADGIDAVMNKVEDEGCTRRLKESYDEPESIGKGYAAPVSIDYADEVKYKLEHDALEDLKIIQEYMNQTISEVEEFDEYWNAHKSAIMKNIKEAQDLIPVEYRR